MFNIWICVTFERFRVENDAPRKAYSANSFEMNSASFGIFFRGTQKTKKKVWIVCGERVSQKERAFSVTTEMGSSGEDAS